MYQHNEPERRRSGGAEGRFMLRLRISISSRPLGQLSGKVRYTFT
jgi:hypothetical protein